LKIPLEAALGVCVGFNIALALAIIIYIISLRVDPNNFQWLQSKAKVGTSPNPIDIMRYKIYTLYSRSRTLGPRS